MIKFARPGNSPEETLTNFDEIFEKLYAGEGRFIIENEYDANILNYVCEYNQFDTCVQGYFDKPGTYHYNFKRGKDGCEKG